MTYPRAPRRRTSRRSPSASDTGSPDGESTDCAPAPRLRCPDCGSSLRLTEVSLEVSGVSTASPQRLRLDIGDQNGGLYEQVAELQRRLIRDAMRRNAGVKTQAAEDLGMKYTTFLEMGKRLGLADFVGDEN